MPQTDYGAIDANPPAETNGYVFNHTMLRVKDPEVSLQFYTQVFGMELLERRDMPAGEFTLYFLGRTDGDEVPGEADSRRQYMHARQGILELTHNWGTEDDPNVEYHDGNASPQGYGHICFTVPDLEAAVAWMDQNDVEFQKRPEDGRMKHIAFVRDPDGYWIELVGRS